MLTVIKYSHTERKNGHVRAYWMCRCTCGKTKTARGDSIKSMKTSSCGCIHKIHGLEGTRFYRIWRHMKSRCYNSKIVGFKYWGGRGIKVCDRWQQFVNFRDDMYNSYVRHVKKHGEKNTTIDRIDNDGDYTKENCRWATYLIQSNNNRNTRKMRGLVV